MIGLYNFYIALMSFLKGIGLSSSDKVYFLTFILGIVILGVKISRESYSSRELITVSTLIILGIVDYFIGKTSTILFTAITIAGLKNEDFKSILKVAFFSRLFALAIMVLLSTTGVIDRHIVSFWRYGEIIYRNSFGFSHPNSAHMSLVVLTIIALYLYYNKIKWYHLMGITVLNYYFYTQTYSRSGFLILIISVLVYLVSRIEKIRKSTNIVFKYSFIFFIVASFVAALLYKPSGVWLDINNLITGRLGYMSAAIHNIKPSLIGNASYKAFIVEENGIILDNGYFKLLYEGGIIVFAWFIIYEYKLMKFLYKENAYKELMLVFLFNFYSLNESVWASAIINLSLLLLGLVIFSKFKIDGKKFIRRSGIRKGFSKIRRIKKYE